MMPFLFSVILLYLSWWTFSSEIRKILYKEWTLTPFTTWDHLKGAIPHVLRQFSPQNNRAQCFADGEIKLLNQRRSFMLLSFHRIALVFLGLIFLATLQIEVFISLIVVATFLLMFFFKKPVRWIQIAFLAGVFFMTYQWGYYQASQWIYSVEPSPLVYFLADGRLFSVLGFLIVGILISLLTRYEHWSFWLGTLLFIAGGIAYLNLFALLLGESLGWALYWYFLSRHSSRKNLIIQREYLILNSGVAFLFLTGLFWAKSIGLLDIRILDGILNKKLTFLMGWVFWEILLTAVIMIWGHFRSQGTIGETTDLESIKLPTQVFGQGLLKYRGWLSEQLHFRYLELKRRLDSLRSAQEEFDKNFFAATLPGPLVEKSRVEVESLKQLLGALSKNSV
jgi:hypothetical protein